MTKEEVLQHVKEFVAKGKLMQLATCSDEQPWVINCWYTFDDDFNFYFISGTIRRHTKELIKNPKVAFTITPHYPLDKLGQRVQGVSFEGIAEEVSGFGLTDAFDNFTSKWELATKHISIANIKNGVGSKLYKIRATKLTWIDEINYPHDSLYELDL